MLGIIGGMGPQAGNHLFERILKNTPAKKDQDHLPVVLWSTPHLITDRTMFLQGKAKTNPALMVANIATQLYKFGVQVIGIPCNTFHAPLIWNVLQQKLQAQTKDTLRLINMVQLTVDVIVDLNPEAKVGIIGTLGTYENGIYANALTNKKISFVEPVKSEQVKIHQAIYDTNFGIKANNKITAESLQIVKDATIQLNNNGANIMLLGCTELSLMPVDLLPKNIVYVDPVEVLAKAMMEAYL